jgi:signal transduction histidine kinase
LDQFAYVASHDLKAPLRAITFLASWISEDAAEQLPPASKTHLDKLHGRIKRMDALLDDLLAYSRAGRQRHPPEWVDTADLVQKITQLLVLPPGFAIEATPPLPLLYTERAPLETVLRNLCDNAIKHHDHPADGRVEVSARMIPQWIEFTVQDNGPGIDPLHHERVFQMFQTLKPRDEVEGSGMGLAIIKKTVESQGGAITLESTPGHGATFRFTWPRRGA